MKMIVLCFPHRMRGIECDDVRMAALSTMLRIVNLFIALSFGVHLEQLEQRMGFTWPRPFLLRPLFVQTVSSVFARRDDALDERVEERTWMRAS